MITDSLGSILAMFIFASVQNQHNFDSYFIDYLIASLLVFTAAVLFMIGWKCYINIKPYDSVLMKFIPVFMNATHTWYRSKKKASIEKVSAGPTSVSSFNNVDNINEEELSTTPQHLPSLLDFAKAANGGHFSDRIVDDVKYLKASSIVFLLLIPQWLIYYQASFTILLCIHDTL